MIALLSPENTGTHFTAGVIKSLTGRNVQWATPVDASAFSTPDIGCMIQHVYPPDFLSHADGIIRLMLKAEKVVVPMRNPVKALISNHDRGHRALPFRDHVRSFRRALTWPEVHYFQIDTEEREREAQSLARYLEVEPRRIIWTPDNVTPAHKRSELRAWEDEGEWAKLDDALDGALSDLYEIREYFRPFGYEIPCPSPLPA